MSHAGREVDSRMLKKKKNVENQKPSGEGVEKGTETP